jgi:hypothetical protein
VAKISPQQFYTSHRDDARKGGEAPPRPHLAVRVRDDQILAIPEGTHLFLIRDPRKLNGVFEVIFERLKFENDIPKEIHFVVPSNDPTSTRKAIATLAWHGDYKSWVRRETERAAEQARDGVDAPPDETDE